MLFFQTVLQKFTDLGKKAYHTFFGVKLGDQNEKRKSMPFGVPLVWREGKNHIADRYFCMTNIARHHVQYSNVPSAIKPVSHVSYLPVLVPDVNVAFSSDLESSDMLDRTGFSVHKPKEGD